MRFILATLGVLAVQTAAAQHVHGGAKLEGRVDGARLVLELQAPLEDLAGFERQPGNDAERAAIAAVHEYFKSGEAFSTSAAAKCRLGGATSELATRGKKHVDVVAALVYECADIKAIGELRAALFDRFRSLKFVEASVATAKGRQRARLTPAKRSLVL